MQAFNELRKQARARRDSLVEKARTEYEATLVKIAVIEQDILGRDAPTHRSVISCVSSLMPAEGTFTSLDMMAALEALDPRRPWRKRAVDHAIQALRRNGRIRRIARSKAGINGTASPAIYTRIGSDVEPIPFEGMELPEVIYEVLRGKSLNRTELTVALVEAGYRTKMTQKGLRDHVGRILNNDGRFRKSGDRWGC